MSYLTAEERGLKKVRKIKNHTRVQKWGRMRLYNCLGIEDEFGNIYSMHVDQIGMKLVLKKENDKSLDR